MSYLDWLAFIAIPDGERRESYQNLILALYNEEFYWSVEHDENRADEGEYLRLIFENETGEYCDNYSPCSVLEMLVALAIRWENELMYDPDEGDRTSVWFWEMIENLGLDSLDNYRFDIDEFSIIMDRFMGRTYDSDGYGGLFYIEDFDYDMRKIELWYQLNYYVKSHYEW